MLKVGFVDYYLDEWHANNYPKWISDISNGRYEVAYAWAKIDSPHPGGRTSRQWADDFGIELCESVEDVVAKSDVLIVLSPDNAEQHEELARIPLQSGKHVYIDKTFTNDAATAKRIFDWADSHHSECFSSSALRFATEHNETSKDGIVAINSVGGGTFEIYSIHQIEPIIMLMGSDVKRVMFIGNEQVPGLKIEFSGNRFATLFQFEGGVPFSMNVIYSDHYRSVVVKSDFFQNFIKKLIEFFDTGVIPAKHDETIAIMGIREAGIKAAKKPGEWVDVSKG